MAIASVIRVGAWGDAYVRSAEKNILRCLLAPNNLPALARRGDVTVALYVGGEIDRAILDELESVANVAYTDLREYPRDNLRSRALLATTEFHSLQMARDLGADWYNFQCDHLINDGFLSAVRQKLDEGYGAVAASPFRIESEKFAPLWASDDRIFTADELYQLSLRCRHEVTLNYFMCDPPRHIPADPHQFFFAAKGGFAAHTFQPYPYGIRTTMLDRTLDAQGSSEIPLLSATENVYLQCDPPGEFFLTGLDAKSGIPAFGEFSVDVKTIVRSIRRFARDKRALDFAKRTLRERIFYPVADPSVFGVPENSIDETRAIGEIVDHLDHDFVFLNRLSRRLRQSLRRPRPQVEFPLLSPTLAVAKLPDIHKSNIVTVGPENDDIAGRGGV